VNPRNLIPARNAQPEEWGDHFAAPLGSSRSGRLRFMNGAHRTVVRSDPRERGLYRARFGSRTPTVGVQGRDRTISWFSDRRMAQLPVGACRRGCGQLKHPLGHQSSRQGLQVSRRHARVASRFSSPWRHAVETAGANS
jgi:hypothetical protein